MNDVTHIRSDIGRGDLQAAEQLLPLVYDELRQLAAQRLAQERPGQTLQATALVHEAYLRLVDVEQAQTWNGRGHFFAAAAEAMRRILVEKARSKARLKRGGGRHRVELDDPKLAYAEPAEELIAIDEALEQLEREDPLLAVEVLADLAEAPGQVSGELIPPRRSPAERAAIPRGDIACGTWGFVCPHRAHRRAVTLSWPLLSG